MFRDLILDAFRLDETPQETRAALKREYDLTFGKGAYARIAVPDAVKKKTGTIFNGYENLSHEEYYRVGVAKKRLAARVGTDSHYAKTIVAKSKEKREKDKT